MFEWFATTLRTYPEIAIFLSLGIGYYAGRFTFRGIGLGAVTSTLLAAVIIGQIGITISGNVKSVFFLMFLFAVGYGVGPQFVRGIAKDGVPQAVFAAVVCLFCLGSSVLAARLAGVEILTISVDLPMAQKRWCAGAGIERVKTLSDHRTTDFGRSYGVLVKGGPLDRFLSRAIFVVDKNDKLAHVEYVPEIAQEPNYDAALNAARTAAGA